MNRLVDEWATIPLTQFDAETRFRALAAVGRPARGLALLDKLDSPTPPSHSPTPPRPSPRQ